MSENIKCDCEFCKTYDLVRWATIMECGCACHDLDYPTGHDSLCCSFPNGKKKDNPYKELKSLDEYKKILNSLEFVHHNELHQPNIKKPKPEDFGWHNQNGFDDEISGWMFEGGEEEYFNALKEWNDSQ